MKKTNEHIFTNDEKGFSLLEIAIVMFISSIIITSLLSAYKVYIMNNFLTESRGKQSLIRSAISSYSAHTGAFPCPSDPSLPQDNPMAGVSDCTLFTGGSAMGTCTGALPSPGLCVIAGARDTIADTNLALDPVLIGGIPYKTLGLSDATAIAGSAITVSSGGVADGINSDMGVDPWGYQMSYAVSAYMTDPLTNKTAHGAIQVQTELGVDLVDPPGSAHYILVGYGNNHAGAYTVGGRIATPCATTAGTPEEENCDGDAVFVRGLRTLIPGANYYDDTVKETSFSLTKLWAFTGTGSPDIFNLNLGNVGVGTLTPGEKLHVVGDLRAAKISQENLCDSGGSNCFAPGNLGSIGGSQCSLRYPAPAAGNVWVVTGLTDGHVTCTQVPLVQVLTSQSCTGTAPKDFVVGFDSLGNIICAVVP